MENFNILHLNQNTWLDIEYIEKKRNAKYVGDFSVCDSKGNWANYPVSIFYQETPPQPDFSHYFGLFFCPFRKQVYITSGQSAVDHTWTAMVCKNGKDVIYSRYRHDYVTGPDGEMLDGGPEYTRMSLPVGARLVNINIFEGQLRISEIQQ